jgi:hypothetical protein
VSGPAGPPEGGAPDDRVARYRIGVGTLVSLLAGRVSYRLVLFAITVALLPVWGEQQYGTFAAAMAAFSWLTALVFTGPEKTMLKLLPRAPRTGPAVTEALVAVLWWLPLPLAAGYAATWLAGTGTGAAVVYVGVAAMQLSVGCTMLLVGLHRAAGRPRADTAAFLTMSVVQVGLLGAAAGGHLLPAGYVGAVTLTQLCVNAVLTVRLGRPSLRIRARPRFLMRLVVTAVLLSGTDLFLLLSTAVLFVTLQATADPGEVGRLYVATLVFSLAVGMLLYVLRVYAPRTSLRFAGRAGTAGRDRAARLATVVVGLHLVWLAGAGVAAAAGVAGITAPGPQMVVWSVMLAAGVPAFAILLLASYLLENTDATAPRVVAAAAATGLVAAAVSGLALIPSLGGFGLIVATMVGETAYAAVVAARARPPSGAGPAGRGRRIGVPWRGQGPTVTRSAPAGTRSSSTGRREPGSENVTTPSRSRA